MLRMLDLFAGIGGFSYAGEKLVGGYETVAFCEYDEHAQKVLRKHWPDVEIIKDVRNLANDADRFRGLVDIICGGYPCQPFSQAGKRLGDQDDRHLWPEMLRVIKAVRPRWVIGENVAGHVTMGLDTVLSDLEAAGYTSRCFVVPAVAVDAPHRRDRCWIVANSDDAGQPADRRSGQGKGDKARYNARRRGQVVADAGCQRSGAEVSRSGDQSINGAAQEQRTEARNRFTDCGWWEPEPDVRRVAYGIPGRVHRLRQLGNSIVPQVAARFLHAIKEVECARD